MNIGGAQNSVPVLLPRVPTQISDTDKGGKTVESGTDDKSNKAGQASNQAAKITQKEQAELNSLKARDREVRAHEQAHIAAGGSLVSGGASFTYSKGPDGKNYAVSGEVSVDTSVAKTPEETIQKAAQIRRAALAPANPSAQDRKVAAQASQMELEARQQLQAENNQSNGKTVSYQDNESENSTQTGQLIDLRA